MRKSVSFSMGHAAACFLSFFVLVALPLPVQAADSLATFEAVNCPVVRLEHWSNSSHNEKLSLLLGFASLLEMEKEWQGRSPLPIKQSTIGTWVRGLAGNTLGQMVESVDAYVAQHPEQMETPVFEVLGRIYVHPILTREEKAVAEKRVREIKAHGQSRR